MNETIEINGYVFIKLVQEINKIYYTKYQDTVLHPIKNIICLSDLYELIQNSRCFYDIHLYYQDLLNLILKINAPMEAFTSELIQVENDSTSKIKQYIKNVNSEAHEILNILSELSDNACIVGGFCRDSLLDKTSKDIDFVTDTDYDKLVQTFTECGYTIKETGKHFLVLNIIKNNKEFEIANFRKDGTYTDGRRPNSVDIGDINSDAKRRDFTINALYFNIKNNKIIDPLGTGIDDIQSKTLRFIGNPKERIKEDYLRVFRFFRFLGTKNLRPHPKSLRVCRTIFSEAMIKTNPQRVLTEMERMTNL